MIKLMKLIADGILARNAEFIFFLKYNLIRVWTEDEWMAWH